ncbi:MAG: alpha/beta hydrolase [Lysobacterales bacterium]|nr:alpha/beta hydrolase [Xanthomonadales bacterium]MCP5475294.1 alpha/beta hydrolase [Rhodanobacteraceae bacterium]
MLRMLSFLVATAIALYLFLCAFLWASQTQMIFLPQGTRVRPQTTDFELFSDGLRLRGWCVNPGQSRALIYFGGNAEAINHQRERFARWFPQHTVYLLAYRGYGASEGSPSEVGLKQDALTLYDHIAGDHTRIDVIGRSVGSGVALHLAARRAVGRLALITPYDSLVAVAARHYPWFPVRWLLHQRFEATADAVRVQVPTLLLIARQDEIIPPAHAEALTRAFSNSPEIQWLDTDHNTVEKDARFALALQRFFRE